MMMTAALSTQDRFRTSYRPWQVVAPRAIAVAVIGPGGVGGTMLDQWRQVQQTLAVSTRRRLELRALCNSDRMVLSQGPLNLADWESLLANADEAPDFSKLTYALHQHIGDVVVVDVTASPAVAALHQEWLQCGFAVLTANKHAVASDSYHAIRRAEVNGGGSYLCETTVGAGLPIVSVLADLVRTGDEVLRIEGVLSGTLSHLASRLEHGEKFSRVLRDLHASGFTEPDPRVDLSGMDVARKLVILGRIAGFDVSLADVVCESFVPIQDADQRSVSDYLASCGDVDGLMAERVQNARARQCSLRYVASIERQGGAQVGPIMLSSDHALSRIPTGDNLVRITTRRYRQSPLVIQGPGAGREVTAAGLLADLIRLATR